MFVISAAYNNTPTLAPAQPPDHASQRTDGCGASVAIPGIKLLNSMDKCRSRVTDTARHLDVMCQ
jgi:hypothetical protein